MKISIIAIAIASLLSSVAMATEHSAITGSVSVNASVGSGVDIASGVNGSVTQLSNASLTTSWGATPVRGEVDGTTVVDGNHVHTTDIHVNGITIVSQTVGSASSSTTSHSGSYSTAPYFTNGTNAFASGGNVVTVSGTVPLAGFGGHAGFGGNPGHGGE